MNPETAELTALRRVSAGQLTIHNGGYVLDGHAVTGELACALVRLRAAGYVAVAAPRADGHRPVHTTAAGALRATELDSRRD